MENLFSESLNYLSNRETLKRVGEGGEGKNGLNI